MTIINFKSHTPIKVVCFDLGGIILKVDWSQTLKRLGLTSDDFEAMKTQILKSKAHDLFERGQLSSQEFFQQIKEYLPQSINYPRFEEAFNACLSGYIPGVEELIQKLPPHLPLYALSNTNSLHLNYFKNWPLFKNSFKKIMASCELNCRKPEKAIYLKALAIMQEEIADLCAPEVLFIDDLKENLKAGAEFNLATAHCDQSALRLLEIFQQANLINSTS